MVSSLIKHTDGLIDEEIDDVSHEKHKRLLQTITSKTKRKIQPTTRNEPSLQVSEFHLSSSQQTTNVEDLANALKKKAPKIRQKVQVAKSNKKLLQKPLDKIHAEKIKRAVVYDNFKKHISRWSAVIEKNKSSDQLIFPLKSNEVEVFDNRMVDITTGFSQPTDLQKKITHLLQSSEIIKEKQSNLKMSWMEKEKEKYPLTLKELLEKRKTMAKFRAQESFRHAKAHRQNKIKSKKYHRLLKKEKTKEQIKEFEKLQGTDPVAALEKLNAIEKTRAEERASLRHKSTGQWARNHVVRAKYDKDSRIALAEQLRKSKELTQKVGPSLNESNDSDDSDNENIEVPEQVIDPENPWLAERKEFTDFMAGYSDFVKNNCNLVSNNDDQNNNSKLKENNCNTVDNFNSNKKSNFMEEDDEIMKFNELIKNHKIIETEDTKKNKYEPKIKNVKIEDLSILSDVESDVDVIQIINPENKDIKSDVNFDLNENKKNNIKIIHTIAGTWHVSADDIHINSKKRKMHKDVENAFRNVETLLKNKIDEKLVNLNNKVVTKQPSKKDFVKHNHQNSDTEYLKINNKCKKTEFDEPLYENNKKLNTINKTNVENNQKLNNKIVEKSTQQDIDPTEFIQVTQTSLETEEMIQVEDHLDDKEGNEQEKLIAEAFADDDIINEFKYKSKLLLIKIFCNKLLFFI
ncbi:Hypothetical protein CINCED_3A011225 [Cinara cedri]|uniref:Uncharacterized protein n=1 Tax=Cinara cedri TaxID=506608 RepID=A0A5E4NCG6_9HEMI|nr:Hypothetical protein CINCED_3A011225 [Cinara cedri]